MGVNIMVGMCFLLKRVKVKLRVEVIIVLVEIVLM